MVRVIAPEHVPVLGWDDPALAVKEPALRARYRRLQSWYREMVLGAAHGAARGTWGRPIGSMLADSEVARDRALNFFDDPEILAYVDARVPEVLAAGGTLNEHRLRHNMLSSTPMAFSLAAALRTAPDRTEIIRDLFGLDIATVTSIDAEWAPPPAAHLGDRTAFDMVVHYLTRDGTTGVLGIETKYTEPLSPRGYDKPLYGEVTEASGWFSLGAAEVLGVKATNQLWRDLLLAASLELSGEASVAHLAAIGLADDAVLWASIDTLRSQLDDPTRVLPVSWQSLVARLRSSSLASFGELFNERYLDVTPLNQIDAGRSVLARPRRSTVATRGQRRWRLSDWSPATSPDPATTGDDLDWGRWTPTVWRAINDSTRVLAMPHRAPSDHLDAAGWWSPLLHLSRYSFGWTSPAIALDNWDRQGRPLDDPRLSLIETVWGRHIDAILRYLWCNAPDLDRLIADELELPTPPSLPTCPTEIARPTLGASFSVPNPATGGSDPLHLDHHAAGPIGDYRLEAARLLVGDLGVSGPPRATLVLDEYQGWYRALHDLGETLPGNQARQSWRVDVTVMAIGHLGTYRQSRVTGRWFAGPHHLHALSR